MPFGFFLTYEKMYFLGLQMSITAIACGPEEIFVCVETALSLSVYVLDANGVYLRHWSKPPFTWLGYRAMAAVRGKLFVRVSHIEAVRPSDGSFLFEIEERLPCAHHYIAEYLAANDDVVFAAYRQAWDIVCGFSFTCELRFRVDFGHVRGLVLSTDELYVASASVAWSSNFYIDVLAACDGMLLRRMEIPNSVRHVALGVSPSGMVCVICRAPGAEKEWLIASMSPDLSFVPIRRRLSARMDDMYVAFSRAGEFLLLPQRISADLLRTTNFASGTECVDTEPVVLAGIHEP